VIKITPVGPGTCSLCGILASETSVLEITGKRGGGDAIAKAANLDFERSCQACLRKILAGRHVRLEG